MHEGNLNYLVSALKRQLAPSQLALLIEALEEGESTVETLYLELIDAQRSAIHANN